MKIGEFNFKIVGARDWVTWGRERGNQRRIKARRKQL